VRTPVEDVLARIYSCESTIILKAMRCERLAEWDGKREGSSSTD
jgi:hypothetical protein